MGDERPAVWVGHLAMTAADPARSHDFYAEVGMRTVHRSDDMAILELRGGTHLLLLRGAATPGPAPFDLMVDDLDATRAAWHTIGLPVSEVAHGSIHDQFTLTDPDGHELTVQSSHVEGVV
jgi:catechol 2,3-dioxygenase-like lactoylglutathione lyase family enzyme